MRGRITRLVLLMALVSLAAGAAAGEYSRQAVERDASESLRRAQLEQELIMAEGTATMYGDFEAALLEMDAPRGESR